MSSADEFEDAISTADNENKGDSQHLDVEKKPGELDSIASSQYTKDTEPKDQGTPVAEVVKEDKDEGALGGSEEVSEEHKTVATEPEQKEPEPIDPALVLPDRGTIRDILRLNQVEAILDSKNTDIKHLSYDRNTSNYLLQSKYSQLKDRYKSLDRKQQDAINSGTENIKNTFNAIKQTVGGFNEMFAVTIDWEFWEQIVNNYEQVITKDPDHLNSAITSGIPKEFRGIIWQLVAESKNFELEEFYLQLKSENSIHEKSIKRDLTRTSFFTNVDAVGKSQELFNVIKAYSLFDPDVGYTQGMIFITVPLIMNMTEAECFCLLVTLMKDYRIRDLFCPEMKGLHLFLYEFDRLLEVYSPILYNHLVKQGIKSSMYASQWFLTFFAYKFPLDIVLRIYDILITQGSESILKFAVNLMIKNQENLLLLKFDKLLEYLKDKMFNVYVNDNYITKPGDKTDNRRTSTISKRFSILGSRRTSEIKPGSSGLDQNYYKLDELVDDSMGVNIDPNELLRFEQEFENIYQVEESKLNDIKELKVENGNLRKTIKDMEMKYLALNRDHVDIVQKMIDIKVTLPDTLMENEDLQDQIQKLQADIGEIEAKVQSPISETAPKDPSNLPTNLLPESIENNINQLLLENAQQLEKFSELEAEYNDLVDEDHKLSQVINQAKRQSWFGKWN